MDKGTHALVRHLNKDSCLHTGTTRNILKYTRIRIIIRKSVRMRKVKFYNWYSGVLQWLSFSKAQYLQIEMKGKKYTQLSRL